MLPCGESIYQELGSKCTPLGSLVEHLIYTSLHFKENGVTSYMMRIKHLGTLTIFFPPLSRITSCCLLEFCLSPLRFIYINSLATTTLLDTLIPRTEIDLLQVLKDLFNDTGVGQVEHLLGLNYILTAHLTPSFIS